MERLSVGRTPIELTRLAFGGAPLGGLFDAVSDDAAQLALERAWDAGIRYFDTAPLYGFGLSEQRIGAFLQTKPRAQYVISTKVGRLLYPAGQMGDSAGGLAPFVGALPNDAIFDFRSDAVKRSLEQSLTRLGLDRVDIAYIHDPDDHFDTARNEAYPALRALREQGVVGAIGAGMNQWQMLERFVRECDLDAVILAGRYTLLDRSAEQSFLPLCSQRRVAVVAAGVFNSGILARATPADDATYDYVPAAAAIRTRARAMADACARHGATLPAAAISFAFRHPAVASVLLGMRTATEVDANVAAARTTIPAELWAELDAIAAGTHS